jgi:hypothetical protein
MAAPTGMVLDSRNTSFLGEEITMFFIPNDEYPFLVTNGLQSFDCISYREALDKFEHFYSYAEVAA